MAACRGCACIVYLPSTIDSCFTCVVNSCPAVRAMKHSHSIAPASRVVTVFISVKVAHFFIKRRYALRSA
jgi:hypothetical protein